MLTEEACISADIIVLPVPKCLPSTMICIYLTLTNSWWEIWVGIYLYSLYWSPGRETRSTAKDILPRRIIKTV